jgi:Ca-activated chloride channel homolog
MRCVQRQRLTRGACLLLGLALAFFAAPQAPSRAQADVQPPARETPVSILLTAVDKGQKFVTTLNPEDLRLKEDGAERALTGLRRQSDLPLFLTVAVDTSVSQERVLEGAKFAADVFVRGIMRPGVDMAAVVSFSQETTLEQAMTGDAVRVRKGIANIKLTAPPGYVAGGVVVAGPRRLPVNTAGWTALWDAVWVVSDEVMSRALGTGRRALVVITDGEDTGSRWKLEEAVRVALQSEVAVYAVGVGDKRYNGVNKGALRKLAVRTGGRAFFPKKVGDLPHIFSRIQEELLSQYVLTFSTPNARRDGSHHKIEVELVNPALRKQGVEISYPHGYFAGNVSNSIKN